MRAFTPNASLTSRAWYLLLLVEAGLLLAAWVFGERFMVPGPGDVLSALVRLVSEEGLLYELGVSMWTNVQALAISSSLSLLLAWGTVLPAVRPVAELVSKARFFGLAGFTVVFTMVFGGGHALKVSLLVFGMTVFFVTSMASVVASVPRSEFDHVRALRMGPWRSVWEVVVLGRADDAFEALRQNAAIGWVMLTMVEGLVRSEGGLGTVILSQSKYFRLDSVFAILLVIAAVGWSMDAVIGWAKNVFCPHARLTLERK